MMICSGIRGLLEAALIGLVLAGSACARAPHHPPSPADSTAAQEHPIVKTGAQVLIEQHLPELRQHHVGLVMNPTARIGDTHMLDTLLSLHVPVKALFAPEHGFRGDAGAGETIRNGVDSASGLPIYSLYGKTRKPTPQMLQNVDLLVFDMQDVGARFYTYLSTLGLILEAAGDAHIPVWILDRPNPAGGNYMAGWIMQSEYESFVGAYPLPVAHGMTLGELALLLKGEGWLNTATPPDIRVIKMEGWHRDMRWPQTGLTWTPPSPNLPRFKNALVYLGTCLFEGTSLSEGRGTGDPFMLIGAPGLQVDSMGLEKLETEFHVALAETTYTPRSIPGKSLHPKFEGQQITGVHITLPDSSVNDFKPVSFGVTLLRRMLRAAPDAKIKPYLYKLSGSKAVDELIKGRHPEDIPGSWRYGLQLFRERRGPYLLYD